MGLPILAAVRYKDSTLTSIVKVSNIKQVSNKEGIKVLVNFYPQHNNDFLDDTWYFINQRVCSPICTKDHSHEKLVKARLLYLAETPLGLNNQMNLKRKHVPKIPETTSSSYESDFERAKQRRLNNNLTNKTNLKKVANKQRSQTVLKQLKKTMPIAYSDSDSSEQNEVENNPKTVTSNNVTKSNNCNTLKDIQNTKQCHVFVEKVIVGQDSSVKKPIDKNAHSYGRLNVNMELNQANNNEVRLSNIKENSKNITQVRKTCEGTLNSQIQASYKKRNIHCDMELTETDNEEVRHSDLEGNSENIAQLRATGQETLHLQTRVLQKKRNIHCDMELNETDNEEVRHSDLEGNSESISQVRGTCEGTLDSQIQDSQTQRNINDYMELNQPDNDEVTPSGSDENSENIAQVRGTGQETLHLQTRVLQKKHLNRKTKKKPNFIKDCLFYYKEGQPGFQEKERRYNFENDKFYLGLNIYVDNMDWAYIHATKKPTLFLNNLLTIIWNPKDLANRALDLSRGVEDIWKENPVQLIEDDKLRLVISLYDDFLQKLKYSAKDRTKILLTAPTTISNKIKNLRTALKEQEGVASKKKQPINTLNKKILRYDAEPFTSDDENEEFENN